MALAPARSGAAAPDDGHNGRATPRLPQTLPPPRPSPSPVPPPPPPLSSAAPLIVIPAYNEERYIGSVVLKALQHAPQVIVVDDGSTDDTAQIAAAAGATVVRHLQNLGKGAALNTGLEAARGLAPGAVVLLDGDGQHACQQIPRLTAPIIAGDADIVVGSRYLDHSGEVPYCRAWGHRLFNLLTNRASGVAVSDSQSGFRALSPAAVEAMRFHSNGFSVESEMQFIAAERGLRVAEAPVTVHYEDRPKRPLAKHGALVLHGLLRVVVRHRPLLGLGAPGFGVFVSGLALGHHVVEIYESSEELAVGYAMLTMLLTLLGMLSMFTGIVLHSVRGLLAGREGGGGR